jgi:Ca2+-binding EF-hand superfamily protein
MSDSIERDRDTFATSRTKIQDASPKSRKESKNAYAKSQLLSTSHERQLHEMFKDIDKNQSGRIEEKELKVPL